jgi:hypothetical protein
LQHQSHVVNHPEVHVSVGEKSSNLVSSYFPSLNKEIKDPAILSVVFNFYQLLLL